MPHNWSEEQRREEERPHGVQPAALSSLTVPPVVRQQRSWASRNPACTRVNKLALMPSYLNSRAAFLILNEETFPAPSAAAWDHLRLMSACAPANIEPRTRPSSSRR